MPSQPPIETLLDQRLSGAQLQILSRAKSVSKSLGMPLFIVGGTVRDLLLDRELRDFDLVVEGDAIKLAEAVSRDLECSIAVHSRFGAATLNHRNIDVDFATARRERYPESGALPDIESGTILEDLGRRDFTINAMAIPIWPDESFVPVDPYSGRTDLEDGRLEVLHDASFVDDPTRMIRGVRLETRLGMELSERSRHLIRDALESDIFDRVSGDRLRHELALSLERAQPSSRIFERMDELGLLQVLLPTFGLSPRGLERLDKAQNREFERLHDNNSNSGDEWLVNLMAICSEISETDRRAVADRLALRGWMRDLLTRGVSDTLRLEAKLGSEDLLPHEVTGDLTGLAPEQLALLSTSENSMVERWIERWILELRNVNLTIRGEDLVRRGHSPGPPIGKALAETHNALLDGTIQPEDELDYALEILEGEKRLHP